MTARPRGSGRSIPDAVIAGFHTMEEKGSDASLAAHLLNDAWKDLFEAAAVISNDTDLVVPIRMVREGTEAARVRRVSRPVADSAAATAGCKPYPPHPPCDAEGGAISRHAAGHGDCQTGGLVGRGGSEESPLRGGPPMSDRDERECRLTSRAGLLATSLVPLHSGHDRLNLAGHRKTGRCLGAIRTSRDRARPGVRRSNPRRSRVISI